MSETAATWLPWRGPHAFDNGVETAFHHALIEFRRPGEAASRCVDPFDLLAEPDLSGAFWRPMIWGREGAANRRPREEATAENIAHCDDGYLFARFGCPFEQIYEGAGLSDLGARRWAAELRRRREWCAARGAEYRWLVVPETHSVLPEKVPGNPAPSADRPIMRILRAADPATRDCIVYPLQAMLDGRGRHKTNSRDDLHASSFGMFLVYRALLATLPACAPERAVQESELIAHEGLTIGGFGYAVGLERYHDQRLAPPRTPFRKMLKDGRFATGNVDIRETDFPDLPTMVTFRTSNTSGLLPYYVRHFSRIVAVAGRPLLPDLVDSELPDVVVQEIAERLIAPYAARQGADPDAGPGDTYAGTFTEFTGHPLPLPRTCPVRAVPQPAPD